MRAFESHAGSGPLLAGAHIARDIEFETIELAKMDIVKRLPSDAGNCIIDSAWSEICQVPMV